MRADPAGYVDSANLYAYVLNDPVNGVDPTGLLYTVQFCERGGGLAGGSSAGILISQQLLCYNVTIWEPEDWANFISDRGPSGGGVEGGGTSGDTQDHQCLSPRFRHFFENNYLPALSVSLNYDVNVALLLGLSAHESGYGNSPMYAPPTYNPFGATPGGDSTPGLQFHSYFQAWQWWGRNYGPYVQGAGTNVGAFMTGLKAAGYNCGSKRCGGDPGWAKGVLGTISGVQRRLPEWIKSAEC